MIFWKFSGKTDFYTRVICTDAVYDYYGASRSKIIPSGKILFPAGRGNYLTECFTHTRALFFKSKIIIFTRKDFPSSNEIFRYDIPIVDERDDIDTFPKRLAIRTDNIDLIRELIARGHLVSWMEPDIIKHSNKLAIFPFEHLFIDPYTKGCFINAVGEVINIKYTYEIGDNTDGASLKNVFNLKYHDELGFYPEKIVERLNFQNYFFWNNKKNNYCRSNTFFNLRQVFSKQTLFMYYTILSITYMLCQKSIVTNVQNKAANKE
jgi:hypothetical protein